MLGSSEGPSAGGLTYRRMAGEKCPTRFVDSCIPSSDTSGSVNVWVCLLWVLLPLYFTPVLPLSEQSQRLSLLVPSETIEYTLCSRVLCTVISV